MKKNVLKKFVLMAAFFSLLILTGFYIKNHLSDFGDIRNVTFSNLTIILFLMLAYFVVQGVLLKITLQTFSIKLRFKEWFGLMVVTLMGNFIVPFAGFGFRAAYLKKVHSFDYTYFGSTLGAIFLIEFLIFTLGGLTSVSFLYFQKNIFNLGLVIFLCVFLLICLVFLFFSPKLPNFKNKLYLRLKAVIESWNSLKSNKEFTFRLIGITCLEFLLSSAMFYFAFRSFGLEINFFEAFLPTSVSDYSLLFRIFPGSFGFYEGAIAYSAKILGYTVPQGLLVTGILRVTSMFWLFTLGPIFSFILIKERLNFRKKNR